EPNESGLGAQSASTLHMQEDEFRVKVEPIQWGDVCRRLEWPEKGDPCSNTFDRQDGTGRIFFYTVNSGRTVFDAGGESEIEKISANEVEIRRKELLPRL
ncbi:hypothetical protein L195_g055590, partial [Trifolium pratense]